MFIKSPMGVYKINKHCVKLLKSIKFMEILNGKY